MKNTTPSRSRWRVRALLCCAAGILLAGCGAGSQGGLSNGPQMAPMVVANAEPAVQPASTEPASPDPAPEAAAAPMPPPPAPAAAAADPAPPGSAAAGANAKSDAFALSGYGASESAGSTDAGTSAAAKDNAAPAQPVASAICKYGGCSFR